MRGTAASGLVGTVEEEIHLLRGQRVLLDSCLATLYGVTTSHLNFAVQRNRRRFQPDFMFRLTTGEVAFLRSHFVISKAGRGGRRYLPYAFTEMGVAMLSSVLRSERAIQTNIAIMRAFIHLRQLTAEDASLRPRLERLEALQQSVAGVLEYLMGAIRGRQSTRRLHAIGFAAGR